MEHFCEIILNLFGPVAHEEIPFKDIFLFFSSGGYFSAERNHLSIFELGNMRIICVELFRFWTRVQEMLLSDICFF